MTKTSTLRPRPYASTPDLHFTVELVTLYIFIKSSSFLSIRAEFIFGAIRIDIISSVNFATNGVYFPLKM